MWIKNIGGYVVGSTLFLLLFPYFIWLISQKFVITIFENKDLPVIVGIPLIIVGLIYILLSNIQMKYKGKGHPVDAFNIALERTKYLMTDGVYKHTRNPMLFGVLCFYVGLAFCFNSYSALFVSIIFVVYMIWHINKFEEPRLLADFNEQYRDYKKKTPILIPFIRFNCLNK